MDQTLERLVERARENCEDGIDELLRLARPLVFRWAMVQMADADDAEDVTQNVLLQLSSSVRSFEGRARFTTWLYRVTANAIAEQRRRHGIRRRILDRLRAAGFAERAVNDGLAGIESERSRNRVAILLRALTRIQRALVDLVDLQGYTPSEAAGMLSMNPNTARVHLMRARRKLRRRLLNDGTAPDDTGPE